MADTLKEIWMSQPHDIPLTRMVAQALVWPGCLCMLFWVPMAGALELDFFKTDAENGEEINEVCAGCHGEFGQGGKQGEYPRLAGQSPSFVARQLHLFRDRKRPNLAMVEYVDDRQMPDEDIRDISAYLAVIETPTRVPKTAGDFNAMEFLLLSRRVLNIPRAPGDVEAGEKIYKKECRSCHGKQGWGRQDKAVPMIAGQYTNYLWRQVDKYLNGIRIHDEDEADDELLRDFSREQIADIFAYLSIVDDYSPQL